MKNREFTLNSGNVLFRLTNEGVYCRIIKKQKKKVYFWPNDELNQEKKRDLILFIFNYFDSIEKRNLSIKPFPGLGMCLAEISLLNKENCKTQKIIFAGCYDNNLNHIIDLINNLIPKRKRRIVDILSRKVSRDPFENDCEFLVN